MYHRTQSRKIPVSHCGLLPWYLLPLKLSVILINYLASTMLPKLHSCGSSSSLHSPSLLWPYPLPLPLQVSLSSLIPTHHPSPVTSLILSFCTLSLWLTFLKQPPPATTSLSLSSSSISFAGQSGWERRSRRWWWETVCLPARWLQSWQRMEICSTHEKLVTPEEEADPEGRSNVDVIGAQHLAKAVYAKKLNSWGRRRRPEFLISCFAQNTCKSLPDPKSLPDMNSSTL